MKIIEEEINLLNQYLKSGLSDNSNSISEDIYDFIFSKSKKLRPAILFLFAKALNIEISERILNIAACTELLHNSTLIHDDIIDNAQIRRGKQSLNIKLGNNLSVLAGDFILSIAMLYLTKCGNIKCFEIFSESLKKMCEGEINQHFSKNKVPSLEEYIEKSKNKTAELFKASLASMFIAENLPGIKSALNFAENFGIAFQIKDDLLNISAKDKTKPSLSDIYNGNYTAPVIFLKEKFPNIEQLSKEEIIKLLDNEEIIKRTIKLTEKYAKKAIASLEFIKDNQYKQELINLTGNLYKAV